MCFVPRDKARTESPNWANIAGAAPSRKFLLQRRPSYLCDAVFLSCVWGLTEMSSVRAGQWLSSWHGGHIRAASTYYKTLDDNYKQPLATKRALEGWNHEG